MRSEHGAAGCVVVGVDPGWRADDVVRAAAREAEHLGTELAIVTVAKRSQDIAHSRAGLAADDEWSESVASRALADAYDALGDLTGRVPTTTYCLWDDETDPGRAPLSHAELLVVGARGRHGRIAFGVASVSRALLKSVHCPVLTVPGTTTAPPPTGDEPRPPVVAGLGEHPWDAAVLRTAAREAATRGTDLHLVHAYVARSDETLTEGLRRAAEHAARATAGLDPGPGTVTSLMLTQDSAATALLAQARDAALIVIGSRPGALSGLLLDSVSRAILESAACPVLVVQRGEPAASGPAGTTDLTDQVDLTERTPAAGSR